VLTGTVLRGAEEQVGAWSTSVDRGSTEANPYLRATTAVQALFAMRSDQVIYYIALTDDEDQRLSEDCVYELSGGSVPARWWSITIYDGAYLPRGGDEQHSVDATDFVDAPDGRWTARVGGTAQGDQPWISSRSAGRPNLVLRLYEPDEGVVQDPSSIDPPSITRVSCEER
jgi:hypothetical protein